MTALAEAPMARTKQTPKADPPEKRMGRPPSADGVRDRALVVKGRDDWKDWVQELSDHCRLDLSDLVDAALVDYARA